MKRVYWLLLGICVVCGCTSKGGGFQCATPESKESVRLDSLSVERLQLDSVATSSFGESLLLPDHHIAFVDKRLCLVSLFDTLGHFQKNFLGIGGAPDETQIGRIAASSFLADGRLVLMGYNLDFHTFRDYQIENTFSLNRVCNDNTIAGTSATYTNQYSDMVCRSFGNKLYFNIYAEHPEFNYLEHKEDYLKHCRHIWEIDLEKEEDTRLLAEGYPESYQNDPDRHVIFCGTCFDVDSEGNFYLSYDTDPYIYVYNQDFEPLKTFGLAGKEMNTDYVRVSTYKEARKYYRSERNTKGYYYWLEYVDETGLLFRSYRKNENADGLQIYQEGILIGDVNVPKGLRVMGYVAPYYYSYIIPLLDEDDDSLIMYRFKLNYIP